jgi:hypothetical protein
MVLARRSVIRIVAAIGIAKGGPLKVTGSMWFAAPVRSGRGRSDGDDEGVDPPDAAGTDQRPLADRRAVQRARIVQNGIQEGPAIATGGCLKERALEVLLALRSMRKHVAQVRPVTAARLWLSPQPDCAP